MREEASECARARRERIVRSAVDPHREAPQLAGAAIDVVGLEVGRVIERSTRGAGERSPERGARDRDCPHIAMLSCREKRSVATHRPTEEDEWPRSDALGDRGEEFLEGHRLGVQTCSAAMPIRRGAAVDCRDRPRDASPGHEPVHTDLIEGESMIGASAMETQENRLGPRRCGHRPPNDPAHSRRNELVLLDPHLDVGRSGVWAVQDSGRVQPPPTAGALPNRKSAGTSGRDCANTEKRSPGESPDASIMTRIVGSVAASAMSDELAHALVREPE